MKIKTLLTAAAFVVSSAVTASAALVFTDGDGNNVNGIGQDAFSFTEFETDMGGGYTFTNNLAGAKVWGFGISTGVRDAFPIITEDDFGTREAFALNDDNWATTNVDFYNDRTGEDIFGDISNVLGDGDRSVNFYQDIEVGFDFGTHTGFEFVAPLASDLMLVAQYNGQALYVRTVDDLAAVPLPAAGWMLIAAVGGLGAMRRRKG